MKKTEAEPMLESLRLIKEMRAFIRGLDFENDCGCSFANGGTTHSKDCLQLKEESMANKLIAKADAVLKP
jgi:hypothetical protein